MENVFKQFGPRVKHYQGPYLHYLDVDTVSESTEIPKNILNRIIEALLKNQIDVIMCILWLSF